MWAESIRQYTSNLLKNEHELNKIGFNTDYSILLKNAKYQLKSFYQTPQGKPFEKVIKYWYKDHKYGAIFLKEIFDNLILRITKVDNGWQQAPEYNIANDIVDGKDPTKDSKSMFEQVFLAGVDAAAEHYPPSIIDTTANFTNSRDKATVTTMIQSAFNSALEARDAADKKTRRHDPIHPPPTNQKQTCRHCKKAVQTSINTGIEEDKCFLNPRTMKYSPACSRNKLEEKGIKFNIMWQGVDIGKSKGEQDTDTVKNKNKINLELYFCPNTPNPL